MWRKGVNTVEQLIKESVDLLEGDAPAVFNGYNDIVKNYWKSDDIVDPSIPKDFFNR